MSKAILSDQKAENGEAGTPHFFGLKAVPDPTMESIRPLVAGIHLRSGDLCPQCQVEHLDYDGLLNLVCSRCGFSPGGGCFS